MNELDYCPKCGNSHEGGCSTQALYFYWVPQDKYNIPEEVLIVGDWSKWQKKEKMNIINNSLETTYFSILLPLSEGYHEYKFLVDGLWMHDQKSLTRPNQFGSLNNWVEILPKKSYTKKVPNKPVKITCNYSLDQLKVIGSWTNWSTQHLMKITYNPLKNIYENEVDIDLIAGNTYEFVFKHKNQYLIDEKYPTVTNGFGTLNNFTIVYQNRIRIQTPRKSTGSMSSNDKNELSISGNMFSWRKVEPKVKLPYERIEGHSMCCVGENLYIFGGKSRSQYINTLVKINAVFDKLEVLEVVPDGRASHHMKAYGNKILVYGGNNQEVLDDYIAFNVSDNQWLTPQKIPKSKNTKKCEKSSCVLYESLLLFFGGCYKVNGAEQINISNDIEVLDLQKMKWIESIYLECNYPTKRFSHTAEIINSDMYVFGGNSDLARTVKLNDLWKINLLSVNSMQWEMIKPRGKTPQPRHGHSMNALKNLLVIFGGIGENQQFLNDTAIYNSLSNQWIVPVIQGMAPRPICSHATANLLDDSIVIFGGRSLDKVKNNDFYIFEPADLSKPIKLFEDEEYDNE